MAALLIALALLVVGGASAASQPIMVVNLLGQSSTTQFAAQVCSGLFNRDISVAGPAYTIMNQAVDEMWLSTLDSSSPQKSMSIPDFMSLCLSKVATGRIRYNYTLQQTVVPNLVTLAAVLDAVPLEDGNALAAGVKIVYDAEEEWAGYTPLSATEYMYENYVNQTSTMSKLDPGYDTSKDPMHPKLTGNMDMSLVDFIVKERMFNLFLNRGCIPLTAEHRLMVRMVANNPWPQPLPVFGYDNAWGIAGDLFEAETTCVEGSAKGMGAVASDSATNLAFHSRLPTITTPQKQNPPVLPNSGSGAFNRSRTYVGLIVGDGDNIGMVQNARAQWMQQRVARCKAAATPTACFPLIWTLSPHTLRVAPDIFRWFYGQAASTGRDFFVLPPSGHLYAYPGLMPAGAQEAFVAATEADATTMSTSGTVEWEFTTTWPRAVATYVPRYVERDIVKALFAVNVPYMIPVAVFLGQPFIVLGPHNNVILFAPREWRGTTGTGGSTTQTVEQMAATLNGLPRGTSTAVYLTSDGGNNLDTLYQLVPLLEEHVQIVDHATLTSMAQQRGGL